MGKHDEYEYKMILTEEEYETVRQWAEANYFTVMRSFVQLNYYYDTPSFFFRERGTTLRVRQSGASLKGTVKTHAEGGAACRSKEKAFPAARLPLQIAYKNEIANLQGVLVTERIEIPLRKKLFLMLDRSSYLGRIDYELELEFPRGGRNMAEQFAEELSRTIREKPRVSKSERFFRALGEIENGGIEKIQRR